MTRHELTLNYPLAAAAIERMADIDPNYGSQQHQRGYIERLHLLQSRSPCARRHEHEPSCYPSQAVQAVAEEQMRR